MINQSQSKRLTETLLAFRRFVFPYDETPQTTLHLDVRGWVQMRRVTIVQQYIEAIEAYKQYSTEQPPANAADMNTHIFSMEYQLFAWIISPPNSSQLDYICHSI